MTCTILALLIAVLPWHNISLVPSLRFQIVCVLLVVYVVKYVFVG